MPSITEKLSKASVILQTRAHTRTHAHAHTHTHTHKEALSSRQRKIRPQLWCCGAGVVYEHQRVCIYASLLNTTRSKSSLLGTEVEERESISSLTELCVSPGAISV